MEFAKQLKEFPITQQTLTSKELHDWYSKERSIVDLQKKIEVVKKFIKAEKGHLELANDGEGTELKKKER